MDNKIQPDITDEVIGLVRAISGDDNAKFHPDGYTNKILALFSRYTESQVREARIDGERIERAVNNSFYRHCEIDGNNLVYPGTMCEATVNDIAKSVATQLKGDSNV